MQIETINVQQADLINARLIRSEECTGPAKEIDPMALAYLNFGLFKELRKRGTSKERICCR